MHAPTLPLMPAAFLGHGSPMNALETNHFSKAWQAFGASVPRPRAVLVISAHWYTTVSAVTAMVRPRTIHDFYGFPQALFGVECPAPGDPAVAEEVADVVKPVVVGLERTSRRRSASSSARRAVLATGMIHKHAKRVSRYG
jgi:4,5-DOPA dioxygenase extradiol